MCVTPGVLTGGATQSLYNCFVGCNTMHGFEAPATSNVMLVYLGYPEDGGSIYLRNLDTHVPKHMASHPVRRRIVETAMKTSVLSCLYKLVNLLAMTSIQIDFEMNMFVVRLHTCIREISGPNVSRVNSYFENVLLFSLSTTKNDEMLPLFKQNRFL